jgi:ATP-dependent DNA helicase RecQ
MTPEKALKKYFGYDSFRPGQEEIIQAILAGRDVLAILPTGGGKSICYQVPALCLEGMALVISPLISLMKDQVDTLADAGIRAGFINSAASRQDFAQTMALARQGRLDLLYVAPERLENEAFLHSLTGMDIGLIAVDEAHCVSQWGHDFRPSYMHIAEVLNYLPERPPMAAFTATATETVREDCITQLTLEDPFIYVASFDRPNLYFSVQKPADKKRALRDLLDPSSSSIIYCSTRKNVERVYDYLSDLRYPVTYYHAGLSAQTRAANQEAFIYDRCPIMVATNAFGMGIDKPNVRSVIHYNMPKDLESYYQEAGRAGRDGAPAEAVLLFSPQDIMLNAAYIQDSAAPNAAANLRTIVSYCNTGSCLRHFILHYFGEDPDWETCGNCSVCDGTMAVSDCTREAQMILSCIIRMGQRFGSGKVIDVLQGHQAEFTRHYHFDKLSTFGLMKDYSPADIRDIISLMVAEGYLRLEGDQYMLVKATEKSREVLSGQAHVKINKQLKSGNGRPRRKSTGNIRAYDEALFNILRKLRSQLAQNAGLPPFVIFNDRTLIEMSAVFPQNEEELRAVGGVGEAKMARYGVPFLAAIRTYIEKTGTDVQAARRNNLVAQAPTASRSDASRRSSSDRTLELLNHGLTIDAIARERHLARTTIENHILELSRDGRRIPYRRLVSREDEALIYAASDALEEGQGLAALKEKLPERITYFELRLALQERGKNQK